MATELKVPKLGMDMEEANILRWLVEEGAEVEKGDPVLEIDTDKVAYEVEANADGTIRGLKGEAGETVPVGATLAYIADPNEEVPGPEDGATANAASATNAGATETIGTGQSDASPSGEAAARPAANGPEPARGPESPNGSDGDGDDGHRRVRASPAARRAAVERGLTIGSIAGSGPGGRVYLSDVLQADILQRAPEEEAVEASGGPSIEAGEEATAGGIAAPTRPPEPAPEPPPDEGFVREPLSSVRRVGAERTAKSFAEVPHFYLTRDLEVDRLLELRERLKAKMDPVPSLTDLLALAVARTLKDHPRLNARYLEGGAMRVNPRVNLGVATATEKGLVVPVLKGADTLPLRELVPAARDAVGRAREGKLGPDDLADGTFTVSNLGMMGIDAFDAIINAPQAAILALGRVRTVPEWREGEWMPLRVISATLSVDHRVADGADGARFLAGLQSALLDWELML